MGVSYADDFTMSTEYIAEVPEQDPEVHGGFGVTIRDFMDACDEPAIAVPRQEKATFHPFPRHKS